jgi:integrase
VVPKFWDGNKAKESLHHVDHKDLNIFLRGVLNEAEKVVRDNPLIDIDAFKFKLDVHNGYVQAQDILMPTFPEYIEDYIKRISRDKRTIQKFEGVKNHLDNYAEERGVKLTFERIDLDFKKDFTSWLYKNGVKSQNTLSKIFSIIKQFMSYAANETIVINGQIGPYHSNTAYLSREFNVSRVKTSKHYLTSSELKTLADYDLSDKIDSYSFVRDLFLISCYSGLRISDLQRLSRKHIIEDGSDMFIQMHTFKGRNTKLDNEVVIPVLPELRALLKKYDFEIPTILSEQRHNDYIKDICEWAEINRMVLHKESEKGEIKETSIPVYSKITNHSGRYTFINMMLNEKGLTPFELQKITGQSLKVLMGYENGDKKANAKKVIQKKLQPVNLTIVAKNG